MEYTIHTKQCNTKYRDVKKYNRKLKEKNMRYKYFRALKIKKARDAKFTNYNCIQSNQEDIILHGNPPDICNTVIEVKDGAVVKWGKDHKVTNIVLTHIFEELKLPYLPIEIIDYILAIKIKLTVPRQTYYSFKLLKTIVETYSEGSGNGKIADWGFAHSIAYKSLYRSSIRSVIRSCKSIE